MKPIELKMKNIGPYLDEKIDFTHLDNMFLIKGDTGAGKTFIFDAMTFALYGVLKGNREGNVKSIISRFVEPTEDASVEFSFEIAGKRYRVNRTVPYDYVNRNGKKSSDDGKVSLEEFSDGKFKAIVANKSETNKKIEEILGLKADEFARIVLLPQGEFAAFLKQNSKERSITLKKLFPVEFYTNITENIKKKFEEKDKESKTLDGIIQTLSAGRDFTNGSEIISNLKGEIEALSKKIEDLNAQKTKIAQKFTELKNQKNEAEEFNSNVTRLKSLESQKNDFENLFSIIENAEKAKSLREFIVSYENTENNLKNSQGKLEYSKKNHSELKKNFDELDSKKDSMKNLSEKNEKDGQELRILKEKLSKAGEIEITQKKILEISAKKDSCEKEIADLNEKIKEIKKIFNQKSETEILNEKNSELQKLSEQKNSLEKEVVDCKKRDELNAKKKFAQESLEKISKEKNLEEEKLERNKKTLEELEEVKKKQEAENLAYTVSALLEEGKPCPVCGSLEHPTPAKKPAGLLDYSEQMKTFKGNIETSEKIVKNLGENLAREEANLKNFDEELNQIGSKRETALVSTEIEKIRNSILEKGNEIQKINAEISNLKNLSEKKEKSENLYNENALSYAREKSKLNELQNQLGESVEELAKKEQELSLKLEKNKQEFNSWQISYNSTSNNLSAAENSVKNFTEMVKKCSEDFENAKTLLESKIKDSHFATKEEAKNAYLSDTILEQKRESYNKYNADLKSASDSVESGKKKNLRPMEELEKEEREIQGEVLKIQEIYEESQKSFKEKSAECTQYESAFNQIQEAQNKKIALEKEFVPLEKLNNNLSGKNSKNLAFETWALGLYFDQIVEFASRRFSDISDGRFSFELKSAEEGKGNARRGLDLLVLDSYTGKTSDASTLSGGETFEASISLALAITDVVQNNNGGGIQLDSLFIDEGFGTLDGETLEKAMAVLSELGETKMIGMISHVTEMENFSGISSSINVLKTSAGSHIEIN